MSFLISPESLHEIKKNENIVIIDVRSHLSNPDSGFELYKQSHLPGAFYLHLEKDLSGKLEKHGGNHPLPNIEEFAKKLGKLGINENSKVVVYDGSNEMYAPRAWWLLRHIGINQTFVLNGGYTAWVQAGYEVTDEIPIEKPKAFIPRDIEKETVSMEEVRDRDELRSVVIDSRAYDRYIGKNEPLYKKSGHIPGAKNYFWQEVLDKDGNWKSVEQLKKHFADLEDAQEIIVSCGSGISACPNVLALEMAGFKNVKLYVGSFSDWISYEENLLATGEE